MLIRKNILIVLSLTAIIVVSACGGRGTPDIASTLAPIYTAAAQTLQALTTQIAVTPNIPQAPGLGKGSGGRKNTTIRYADITEEANPVTACYRWGHPRRRCRQGWLREGR